MAATLALISDLHANLLALDAVLADLERRQVERIICLGDVATLGPKPKQVIARLRDLGCPCVLGNHDAFMLDPALIHSYTEAPVVVDAVEWCRARLDASEMAFLASFARTLTVEVGNLRVHLYHGTPHSHMQELLADATEAELDAVCGEVRADVYAGGHTHLQMLRQHRGRWVVNPGSVGMPFRDAISDGPPVILPFAEYAIVEERAGHACVNLCRISLDKAALRAQAREALDNPITSDLSANYA